MLKQFEVRESQEKHFTKLVKDFNKILTANGNKSIMPIKLFNKEIKCQFVTQCGEVIKYTVPGTVYTMEIPEGIISFHGHTPIGAYYKIDNIWIRKTFNEVYEDQQEVCEQNFRCDHCFKKINNRNGYWFFRDENNKLIVVGSTCVKKYFGVNPEKLLKKLGELVCFENNYPNDDYNYSFFRNGIARFPNRICYALVKELTKNFSFWEKNDGNVKGTSRLIKWILGELFNKKPSDEAMNIYKKALSNMTDEDEKNIELSKLYWKLNNDNDDFSKNTKNIIESDSFPIRLSGYAAFGLFKAVRFYKDRKKVNPTGNFVGNLKERMDKALITRKSTHYTKQILFKYTFECVDGSRLQFEDSDGNVYVCFCSTPSVIDRAEASMNDFNNYRFTIVEHKTEKNGNRINIINRMKVK